MGQLFQWAFNSAAAVSAVLFVGVVVLWARSCWQEDLVGVNTSKASEFVHATTPIVSGPPTGAFVGLGTYRGTLYFVRFLAWDSEDYRTGWISTRIDSFDDSLYSLAQFRFAGLSYCWNGHGSTISFVGIPLWLVLLVLSLPVVSRLLRARRRKGAGVCPSCGYDLRATPDLCPECGAVPGQARPAAK